jgi:chromatin remodeling complex protein RSC6
MSWIVSDSTLRRLLKVESRGYHNRIDLVKLLWRYIREQRLTEGFQVRLDCHLTAIFGTETSTLQELKNAMVDRFITPYRPVIRLKRRATR